MTVWRVLAGFVLASPVIAQARAAGAQGEGVSDGANGYERRYGKPIFVSLEAIVSGTTPAEFLARAIHTRGLLSDEDDVFRRGPSGAYGEAPTAAPAGSPPAYTLSLPRDSMVRGGITIVPAPEIAGQFAAFAAEVKHTREVDIVGVRLDVDTPTAREVPTSGPTGLRFWAFWAAPPGSTRSDALPLRSMEEVVRSVKTERQVRVRVRGQFRGRDLFPEDSCEAPPSDGWVLRDGPFWIWVTGRKPQGTGWSLDIRRRADAQRWLVVVGRTRVIGDCVVLRAEEVALVSGPRP